jgi:MFS family permease
MAYISNTLVMVGVALLYRYADFITYLGGEEVHLGWIVGIGMVGSVVMRLWLGTGIDRHGPRVIWLGCLALLAAVCWAHLAVTRCDDLWIYLLRVLYCTALAGVFGASTTLVAGGAGGPRMAELIGMLGTSGFLGMMLGTHLGDFICGAQSLQRWHVHWMFLAAGLLAGAAVPFAWLSTQGATRPEGHQRSPLLAVVRRHHPGMVLAVGVATGAALVLPTTFLRTFAAELHIPRIGLFFSVVAVTAVSTRVLTRRWPARIGLARMTLIGLAVMAAAQLLFLLVRREWQLAIPGLAHGVGQAILYPMVTAAGSSRFPARHRGLGTTLVLATLDIGQLIGAPAAGVILYASDWLGLDSYPTMYLVMAVALVIVAGVYAATLRRVPARMSEAISFSATPSADPVSPGPAAP